MSWITTPCHHPKWPMICPKCKEPCDGTGISSMIDHSRLPENRDWEAPLKVGGICIGFPGSYCEQCNQLSILITPDVRGEEQKLIIFKLLKSFYFKRSVNVVFYRENWV